MRKWITVAAIALVMLALAVVAVLNLDRVITRNKDYVLARIEQALGRKVTIGDIGLTLWGGLGARFKDFSIADDPAFSREPFIRGAALQVNLKLLPLLRQKLEIQNIVLRRPVIHIIRNTQGQFNFASIGQENNAEERKRKKKEPRPEPQASRPELLISLVDIDDGVLEYVDRAQGIAFRADALDLTIEEISFDRPIDILLEAAIFGAKQPNVHVKAKVGPVGTEPDLTQLPVLGSLELQPVAFDQIEKTLAIIKQRLPAGMDFSGRLGTKLNFSGTSGKHLLSSINGVIELSGAAVRLAQLPQPITDINTRISFTGTTAELPETTARIGSSQLRLAAKLASFAPLNLTYRLSSPELRLSDFRAGAAGAKKPEVLSKLQSDGSLTMKGGGLSYRGTLSSADGTIADAEYKNLQATASFAGGVVNIESLNLAAFDGSLAAKGRYDLRDATPRFTAVTTVKGMDLTQLLNALAPSAAANIRGRLNLDLDVAGAGKEWEVAQKTLKGQGKVQVIDGALLNFNIADSVLSGTLIQLIPGDIKTKYPEIFTAKDTEFKQLAGSATIANGRAYTNDLVIAAAEFETRPKGWFAFDQTVDFSGPLLFSTRLSQDIIGRAREMKNLANEQGRILIPYTLAGKLPGAKPRPDLGYIARAMQKGFIDQGVERFLRGRSPREGSDPTGGDEGKTGRQQRKRRDTPEDILRGLEGFFRR